MIAILVFLFGKTSRPSSFDRSFVLGTQLRTDIQLLERGLSQSGFLDDEENKVYKDQLSSMRFKLALIMNEAKARQASAFYYNLIAVLVVVTGLICTLFFSWKTDVKRLKGEVNDKK